MTFDGRLNHFTCDDCKTKVAVPSYPKEWIQTRLPKESIKHYCVNCKDNIPQGIKKYKEGQK